MGILRNILHNALTTKDRLGSLTVTRHDNGDVTFNSSFADDLENFMAFAFYVDQTVYNVGSDHAVTLWRRIHTIAGEAIDHLGDEEAAAPNAPPGRPHPQVVPTSSSPALLRADASMCKKGDRHFIEISYSPQLVPDIERLVADGCEALFWHIYRNSGENAMYLSLLMIGQCKWYEAHGYPSVTQLAEAPWAGISAMRAIMP
ncbi:hypothetical protein ACFL6X_09240 [Candidatus Latescibacterota bacterium]